MGSTDDDDRTTEEGTQEVLDSQSPPGSPEIDSTASFNDTIPTEEDTQVLEDIDLEELARTQIPDSDGEGTDRTDVLSENQGETDDDCEKGTELVEDDAIGCEVERGLEGIDALNGQHFGSGSAARRSISVHSALLRVSDVAAADQLTKNDREAKSIKNISQFEKEVVRKGNGVSMIRDPDSTDLQGPEVKSDQGTEKSNGKGEATRGDINCRVDGSTVRRLFTEDAAHNSLPEVADEHEFAGLSYVGSQEPGELSQAYAFNVVDRLISVDEDELSQEMNWGSVIKRNSPPVSMTKGTHMLAQRVKPRSPVGNAEIFEWDDNHEDEGGGVFFSKRKEELLGGSCQQKKSVRAKAKKDKGTVDKLGEKEEHSKLRQKTKKLSVSDSRLPVHNLKGSEKARPSRSRTRKNLRDELDEQLNLATSKRQLEGTALGKDSPNISNVGIDTQMAAEAMEDLASGLPSNHGTSVLPNVPNNAEGCRMEETKNKDQTKRVSHRRRNDSGGTLRQSKRIKTLDSHLSGESLPENQETTKPVSGPATNGKGRKAKSNVIKHLITKTAGNENTISKTRSSKSVKQPVGKMDVPHIKEADVLHKSSALVGNGQMKESNIVCTPVARRTRKSLAVSPLKGSEVSGDNIGEGIDGVREVRNDAKRQSSGNQKNPEAKKVKGVVFDSATKSAEVEIQKHLDTETDVGDNRTSGRRSSKRINQVKAADAMNKTHVKEVDRLQKSPLSDKHNGEMQEERRIVTPVARRTRKSLAVNPSKSTEISCNEIGDGTDAVKVKKGKKRQSSGVSDLPGSASKDVSFQEQPLEANGQSVTTQKKLRANVVDSVAQSVPKRVTRSSVHHDPSSLSSEKKPKLKRTHQDMSVHTNGVAMMRVTRSSAPNSFPAAMIDKLLSTAKDYLSPVKDADANARSHMSPSSNCTTPLNAASPLCVGNDYYNTSCKKSLSRSPLTRELNRLDATEVVHSSGLKDLRKKKDMANVRVLFSRHLDEDKIRQQKKILVRLGASVGDSMSEATHFVTDKFVRTRNMLEAMASGKPVVTDLWLEACGQASCFIDEKKYILRDSKKEKEIRFNMLMSLTKAVQTPILQNKRVYISPNVKPSKELISSLVETVKGQVVERLGKVWEDVLVLSCDEDYATCVPFLEKGVMVYGSELLLNGIVIQKMEYERHRLFADHVRRTRSTIRAVANG